MKYYSTPDFWIIMTLTVLLALCGCLISCNADAARGCLDREQAARTWPTKQLGVDDDNCFTYLRNGVKPAPDVPAILIDGRSSASVEAAVAFDMLDRWPVVIEIDNRRPDFLKPEALMTPRNLATVILSVVLFCAVFEVAFGGFWVQTTPKPTRNRDP